MCNAMEIEVPGSVIGSLTVLTANEGTCAGVLGNRPSQPLTDFFVPVSLREKPAKKLRDETSRPNSAAEDTAKKRKGRPRKNFLEDDSRNFFIPVSAKERQKKTSLIVGVGVLNPATVVVAEDAIGNCEKPKLKPTEDSGSDFFLPRSKRERLNKELFKDEAPILVKTASNKVENGPTRRGRPTKCLWEIESAAAKVPPLKELDDVGKTKKGSLRKILLDEALRPKSGNLPGILQASAKQKQGRPKRKSNVEESNVDDVANPSGSLEDAVKSSGQLPHEGQACVGEVAAQKVAEPILPSEPQAVCTSLMQSDNENSGQKIQDAEGTQVAASVGGPSQPSQPCQVALRGDFFMPVSKRQKHKQEQSDKKPAHTRKASSKPKLQKDEEGEKPLGERVRIVTRPESVIVKEKKSVASGLPFKETPAVHTSEHDLRLEAVLAAQENARLNAGKTTHPFFARKKTSSLKTSVIWEETQAEDLQPGLPIHVTQLLEEESAEVVWSNWKVSFNAVKEGIEGSPCKLKRKRYHLTEFVLPCMREDIICIPDLHAVVDNVSELAVSKTTNAEETISDGNESTSILKALQDLLLHMRLLKTTAEISGEEAQLSERDDLDSSLENLKDRLSWYSARHDLLNSADNVTMSQTSKEPEEESVSSSRNLLWTDLYQPKSSKEVCGNIAAVDDLNNWLYNWQSKITGQPNRADDGKGIKGGRIADYDSDKGWFEGDSDIDSDFGDVDNDKGLQNTLLVTGPEGCGKSAAVYACASEQGFTVIEVNASDYRNGALIKQKFGEAMESHGLGKGSQFGVESPAPASKKAGNVQEKSPGHVKQTGTHQNKLFSDKKLADRSPLKAAQERLIGSQNDSQMDTQSKRKTVILFEDVDKHFEEDKGFLTALVQLSKISKRPIILTSNRCDPGLPPGLEKCGVDFGYPTSEELVLHASLVSIAEDFPCNPWLLERFVESCHYDLRKVMMGLQFWGQGKLPPQPIASSRQEDSLKNMHDIEHDQVQSNSTSNKLKNSCNFNKPSKMSLSHKQGKGSFEHWKSDARRLFELEVHHFILPKVISGSFVCPLTLFVAENIRTAVKEVEEHMEQVAASESEERARAQQVEFEAFETQRKALKKEKEALKRASKSNSRLLEDAGVISSLTPDEDIELENGCGESWACSPVKSLRKTKTLARSPLKPKILKSRRALVLCDSDDEEQRHTQPGRNIDSVDQTDTNLEGVQVILCKDKGADVVNENLEDMDVKQSSISEVMTRVRRKRPSKKDSLLVTGSENLEPAPVCRIVENIETVPHLNLVEPAPVCGTVENIEMVPDLYLVEPAPVCRIVENVEMVPDLNLEPWETQTDGLLSEKQLGTNLIAPRIFAAESAELLRVVDKNNRMTAEFNLLIPGSCTTSANIESIEQSFAPDSGVGADTEMESILFLGGEQVLETSCITATGQRPDSIQGINHADETIQMSNPGEKLVYEEVLQNSEDSLLECGISGKPSVLPRESSGSVTEISESAEEDVTFGAYVDAQKAGKGSISPMFEPVNNAWSSLRKSHQTSKLLLDQDTRADVSSSLAELLDTMSAADVISSVEPEDYKDAWRNFEGSFSALFEGNIGHSSDWDSCQEVASQLVSTGLQHYLQFLPGVHPADYRLPMHSCILESVKDTPAVGECMVTCSGLTWGSSQSNNLHSMVGNISARLSPARLGERQGRLEDIVRAAAFPRGRVSGLGFVDYSGYLSRMSRLEAIRRTNGLSQGRRPRRFEHHLTSQLKSLSSDDITELLKCSTFQGS